MATLVVHGIWDSAARLRPLVDGLAARGIEAIQAVDLVPASGAAPIPLLGDQVAAAARALAERHGGAIDLVGFSMGALASRWFIQRGGGRGLVRRFVSISGPHHGTWNACLVPLAGARQMRPESALLLDLAGDEDPWGGVEVHTLWTPFDLMIVPARSSRLPGARSERTFPVKLHRWMLTDPAVLDHVAAILRA